MKRFDMANTERIEAEPIQIKQQERVRQALTQVPTKSPPPEPAAQTRDKVWFGSYVLLLIGLGVLHYLFGLGFFGLADETLALLRRITRGGMLLVLIVGIGKGLEVYLIRRMADSVSRYNPKRIQKLIVGL